MKRASLILLLLCVMAGAWALAGASARGGPASVPVPDFPIPGRGDFFLRECSDLKEPQRYSCYARGLLAVVEKSRDPAHELPRLDQTVRASGGYLAASCHMLMHEVGRTWGRRHGVTLENFYRFVPKSNDPGCSAGFGMGLVMHLGTQLVIEPRGVLPVCTRLPTRFREYSCIHGSGHALMRGYHGRLPVAVAACRTLGARHAPDCAQGAFHDYWISLSGADGTSRPQGTDTDPRSLCARTDFPLPCWYRFFLERRSSERVDGAADLRRLCSGLARLQRHGCVAGASVLLVRTRDPIDHAKVCAGLPAGDTLSCLRGVNVPILAGRQFEQFSLIQTCAGLPGSIRDGCYRWFGRTLAVVTNGEFGRYGCPKLERAGAREACAVGARRIDQPLRTFS